VFCGYRPPIRRLLRHFGYRELLEADLSSVFSESFRSSFHGATALSIGDRPSLHRPVHRRPLLRLWGAARSPFCRLRRWRQVDFRLVARSDRATYAPGEPPRAHLDARGIGHSSPIPWRARWPCQPRSSSCGSFAEDVARDVYGRSPRSFDGLVGSGRFTPSSRTGCCRYCGGVSGFARPAPTRICGSVIWFGSEQRPALLLPWWQRGIGSSLPALICKRRGRTGVGDRLHARPDCPFRFAW
jgi:hypothetical protein